MKTLLASVAFVICGLAPAMAQDCSAKVQTIAPGTLTVAVYDYPPFSVVGSDGSVGGIDNEIARKIAKDSCLTVKFDVMEPAATIQSVVTGRADVATGSWNRTKKRLQVVDVSAPIYLDHMGILSKDGADTLEGLRGKKVGTVTGYHWVPEMQNLFGADLMLYPDPVSMAQDLLAGRIDAATNGYNYAVYAQKHAGAYQGLQIKVAQPDPQVSASVMPPQIGLLFTKGNATLGAAMDGTIARLQREGKIAEAMVGAGFDAQSADVGTPRLID